MDVLEVPEALQELPPLTPEDHELANVTERELKRRSRRRWVFGLTQNGLLWLAVGGLIAIGVWDHLYPRESVIPFAVVLRVSSDGEVTLVEPIQRLRDLVMPGEAIQDMLGDFVKDLRKLGIDPIEREDSRMNIEAAVCGPAAQQITRPPVRLAELVSVTLTKFRPSVSPKTHTVAWLEQWSDANGTYLGAHSFEADITVERREIDWTKPEAFAIWLRAPMGLCVSSMIINEVFLTK